MSENNPHYGGVENPFEPIKIINYYNLNFNKGNVLKYILRCGKKQGEDEIKELNKIIDYARFEIERIETERANKTKFVQAYNSLINRLKPKVNEN